MNLLQNHFLLNGTGLTAGSTFGNSGLNTGGGTYNGKASAWEIDTMNEAGVNGWGCLTTPAPPAPPLPPQSSPPAGAVVIARGEFTNGRGAELTYHQRPGGNFVLAAGSVTFGGSLVVDPAIQQLVRNALDE